MEKPRQAETELKGKVAIVTGAGVGIGRAIALELAAVGVIVALVARSYEQIAETVNCIRERGGRADPIQADVTDRQVVERLVQEVERNLGPTDLLVNNAGRFGGVGPLWEVEPEEWWSDVETNLYGSFLCTRAVLPGMIARRRGKIVNLAGGGATVPFCYGSGYACSKAAIVRLTDTAAAELREYGIEVYAVDPGLVRTELTQKLTRSQAGKRWIPSVGERLFQGKVTPAEQVAQLVLFLTSPSADFLSGRLIGVADPVVELIQRRDEILTQDLYTLRRRI